MGSINPVASVSNKSDRDLPTIWTTSLASILHGDVSGFVGGRSHQSGCHTGHQQTSAASTEGLREFSVEEELELAYFRKAE